MIFRSIHAAAIVNGPAIAVVAAWIGALLPNTYAGPTYELWIVKADGGKPERFAETPGYTCGSPDWSPDGKLIAYDTWPVGRTFSDSKIAVIRADGTGSKIIGNGGMPSWSPDGKQLICHTYDSPQTIVVMNARRQRLRSRHQPLGQPAMDAAGKSHRVARHESSTTVV